MIKATIDNQYTTTDTFLRACQFAFNESRDKQYVVDTPCPEDWVIMAVYDYLKGKELPMSLIRNPVSLLSKFKVVATGDSPSHMKVIAQNPHGTKHLIA